MNEGKTIFSQLTNFVTRYEFNKCVRRYDGNKRVRDFSCWDQYLCMAFAQLTYRESLRDIEVCQRSVGSKLYHLGIRGKVSRSTLADANNNRDRRIYADFAAVLISEARELYTDEKFGVDLEETVYALDASTIDLCLSVFPWAKFRKTKAGIKLHTLLDLRGNIPVFIDITGAKCHDVKVLDKLVIEPGSIYVMDRGYLDYSRLYKLTQAFAWFVTRSKKNIAYRRLCSNPVDKSTGVRSDQNIVLTGFYASMDYPEKLRRIRYYDVEQKRAFIFLTNNFVLPALTIAELYKCRWQIELFFKWIKQHLRIKSFFFFFENAVKTQIWIAISTYVLVAIMKKELKLENSLYNILQILSLTVFEKTPILAVFQDPRYSFQAGQLNNQLDLFAI
ncbi:MAG: IS4 family transposase [Bdellovibrionales bacterium]|nr:IS4 family transposase [Bdellovibrionales bacterium]